MKERSTSEKLAFRFGYATSLLRGAEAVADKNDPVAITGLPVFLLLGFALENCLASYLIANEHDKPGDYQSHDLERAMGAAKKYGLILSKEASEFIRLQTPLQKKFVFRYPENMEDASLPPVRDACKLVRNIMIDIDTVLRMKGVNLNDIAEQL